MEPRTINIANHCADCITTIGLPLPIRLYDTYYTIANVFVRGNIQFVSHSISYINTCLPNAIFVSTIMPYWSHLSTIDPQWVCGGWCGIYTSISGSAPNRIFNIEWRARSQAHQQGVNFEVRLYEGEEGRFEFI